MQTLLGWSCCTAHDHPVWRTGIAAPGALRPSDRAARIIITTDGACRGNPGPGAWAAIVQREVRGVIIEDVELSGFEADTTNTKMELTAALRALGKIKLDETAPITIRTDSEYLAKGMTEWLSDWKQRGWKGKGKGEVKNRDLREAQDFQTMERTSTWAWVRGHAGDERNGRADGLANQAIDQRKGVERVVAV